MNVVFFFLYLFIANLLFNYLFSSQLHTLKGSGVELIWYYFKYTPFYPILNILIGIGYIYGMRFFENMTLTLAAAHFIEIASLLSITILVFKEIPSPRMIVGLIVILAGILIANN